MRAYPILVVVQFLILGCSGTGPSGARPVAPPFSGTVILPDRSLVGRIIRVNTQARFVVVNFPLGQMPDLDYRLNVYRQGVRVGELKVTGPQRDDNIVADVVMGSAEIGDQVRDN